MIDLLKEIDQKKLYNSLDIKKISELENLVEDKLHPMREASLKLSKFVLATYGYDLLHQPKIRRLLFTLIDNDRLKYLAKKFANKAYDKLDDNALVLSMLPWRSRSQFVIEIAKEFSIPKEFLPLKSNTNQTIELIEPIEPLLDLHYYQEELKTKILNELFQGTNKFLIQMPTGAGKTRTVIEALLVYINKEEIFHYQKSIIWLAHTEELCEQALDTFKDVWQNLANSPAQIVRCFGTYKPNSFDVLGSFVVGTFQKFHNLLLRKADTFQSIEKSCRIIIVDEAHKVIAPTYERVVNKLSSHRKATLIGITATPGRGIEQTTENIKLANFFGKKLLAPSFSKTPISELREKKILAKLNRKIIETEIEIEFKTNDLNEIKASYDLPRTVINRLSNNTERNKIILKVIYKELAQKNPCLVFSCSLDHSRLLSSVLNYRGFQSAYIDCYMRKGSRKRTIDGFRNGEYDVLFNYGVLSTGFDAPRIRSVIITRPTSSVVLYSQMIGRGLRGPKMGGSEFCNLIDIKDNYLNFGGVEDVYSFFEEYWN